jgi:hypothetical protein
MSLFSHFSTILNQNKLTGPNYVDWKRNLDIVLTEPSITFSSYHEFWLKKKSRKKVEKMSTANIGPYDPLLVQHPAFYKKCK